MPKTNGYQGGPTRSRVLKLKRQGLNGMDIAKLLGITHQRVYDHIKELRKRGALK